MKTIPSRVISAESEEVIHALLLMAENNPDEFLFACDCLDLEGNAAQHALKQLKEELK